MTRIETGLKDCFIIEPKIFGDERGYFFESYNKKSFDKMNGKEVDFIQDNQAFSSFGVLRGLHFQTNEFAQAKLVRVLHGKVLDVVVDIREDSETFGKYVSVELSAENKKQLFVPRGFAHGYVVLSETAEFFYKVDNVYSPKHEAGIIFNDNDLKIDWLVDNGKLIISEKDKILPQLKDIF